MSAPPNPPRRLVLFEPLGSSPARLMLAPAGALLPQGVRPVVALAVVADNHRSGRAFHGHAGSATPTPTAGAGPLLGVGGRPSLVAAKANNSGRGRVYTDCHAFADAAGHGRTPGALGLGPLFGAPASFLGSSTSAVGGSSDTGLRGVVVGALDLGLGHGGGDGHGKEGVNPVDHAGAGSSLGPVLAGRPFVSHAVVAATRSARSRLSTECHNVADAAGHGRTAGTLGLGLPPLLGGSTSRATGERLDLGLGDEGGEEDVYSVGLAGPGSALGPVLLDFPSSVPQALVAANHNGRRRLSMECHAVADAVGHGRTAGALGLRPLLGAPTRFLGGSISGATGLRGRVVVGALDLGDGDGEGDGEEDVTDELRFQDAHRHIQAILHLTSLRSRNKTAVHIGLLSTGRKTQSMLDAIGHIDPTAPVYHWRINRCHALLREIMGEDLYKQVIVTAPKEDEGDFGWIVTRGNEVLHGVANFMRMATEM
ncbi:hypothetical protein ACQJBY_044872 [Aegilops geniculata]